MLKRLAAVAILVAALAACEGQDGTTPTFTNPIDMSPLPTLDMSPDVSPDMSPDMSPDTSPSPPAEPAS